MDTTKMLHIRNWDKWQSYRSDRAVPPWIKIHRCLLRERKWISLSDVQRAHLVSIWMLAADNNGFVPNDPAFIRKVCCLDTEPDLKLFIDIGFLDANVTSPRRQADANMTPQTRLDKTRLEKKDSGARAPYAFVGRVISLTQGDYDQWVSSFPNVQLRPYLEARDIFLYELPEDDARRKKWMMSTASDLRNKNASSKEEKTKSGSTPPPGMLPGGRLPVFPREEPKAPLTEEEMARRAKQVAKYLKAKPMPKGKEKH